MVSRIFSFHFFPIDEAFSFVVQFHGEGDDSFFVSLERFGVLVSFYLLFCGIDTTFYNNIDFLRCLILWQCFVFFFISWGKRRLCFSLYIPFHNFFRNFFCKKFCSFNNIFYFYIVLSLLEAPTGRRWDGHIYIKA